MYDHINLPRFHRGKVRDTYEIPAHPGLLAVYASDRMSTYNITHKTPFAVKGELLTAQTVFFARRVIPHIPTHLVASGREIWQYVTKEQVPQKHQNRMLIVHRLQLDRVEFIYRRYLAGSLYKALERADDPYGLKLSRMLPLMYRFNKLVFTPTEKSEHDEPMVSAQVRNEHPRTSQLVETAFIAVEEYLLDRGIALIDAKCEGNAEMLADEFFTGDCCRMALSKHVRVGVEPPFLDKERARQLSLEKWQDGIRRPLSFTHIEVADVMRGYHEAFKLITGTTLGDFQQHDLHCTWDR